jgi:hypothetical protein
MSANPKSAVKEVAIFAIGMGLIVGFGAYYTLTGLERSAPPLWGLARYLAIGIPLTTLSLCNVVAGIILIAKRTSGAVTFCVFSGFAIAAFYFVFMFSAAGGPGVNLITGIMVFLPILLFSRGQGALAELKTPPKDEAGE